MLFRSDQKDRGGHNTEPTEDKVKLPLSAVELTTSLIDHEGRLMTMDVSMGVEMNVGQKAGKHALMT